MVSQIALFHRKSITLLIEQGKQQFNLSINNLLMSAINFETSCSLLKNHTALTLHWMWINGEFHNIESECKINKKHGPVLCVLNYFVGREVYSQTFNYDVVNVGKLAVQMCKSVDGSVRKLM